MCRQVQGEWRAEEVEPSRNAQVTPSQGIGGNEALARADAAGPAGQWAMTLKANQAALAPNFPEGMWLSPMPYLRSRMVFSTSA